MCVCSKPLSIFRYMGHSTVEIAAFVAGSNGIWFFGPAYGLTMCWKWIRDGSF